MDSKKAAREFTVEGHGQSELTVRGGASSARSPFRPEPLLTREGAWSTVKELTAAGRFHTVKVFRAGKLVFRAFRQADGSYIDAATCKAVA